VGSLVLLFGHGLLAHARLAADPWHFNDDARAQIPPLLRYADPRLGHGDYIADYYLAGLPRGYRLVYALLAPWADPRTVSVAIAYLALLVLVGALAATTWTLAGPPAAWATAALCLSTDAYMQRIAGGLPRSLGFPLAGVALVALVRGRTSGLCAVTILGAAFYYPLTILAGALLTFHLFVLPASWSGRPRSWSSPRRVGLLAATAATALVFVVPPLAATRSFGPSLGRADVARYPEAGEGGRLISLNLPVRGHLLEQTLGYAVRPLISNGPAWHPGLRAFGHSEGGRLLLLSAIAGLVTTGYGLLLASSPVARRLLLLVPSALLAHALAFALWPSAGPPERYLAHAFLLVGPVLLPASLTALAARRWSSRTIPTALIVIAATGVIILLLGGRGPGHAGITRRVPPEQRILYEVLGRLPPEALIAGWPDDLLDNVAYLTGRRILVGFESHLPFHRRYVEEMRRRMFALIDAYFASDVAPLQRLRRDFGVTHLLVNRDHYTLAAPTYFKPFDVVVKTARASLTGTPQTVRQAPVAAVFEHGPFRVLDLERVDEATTGPAWRAPSRVPEPRHGGTELPPEDAEEIRGKLVAPRPHRAPAEELRQGRVQLVERGWRLAGRGHGKRQGVDHVRGPAGRVDDEVLEAHHDRAGPGEPGVHVRAPGPEGGPPVEHQIAQRLPEERGADCPGQQPAVIDQGEVRVGDQRVPAVPHEVDGPVGIGTGEVVGLDEEHLRGGCQVGQRQVPNGGQQLRQGRHRGAGGRVGLRGPHAIQPVEEVAEERVTGPGIGREPDQHGALSRRRTGAGPQATTVAGIGARASRTRGPARPGLPGGLGGREGQDMLACGDQHGRIGPEGRIRPPTVREGHGPAV